MSIIPYPSDVSDAEWAILAPLFPPPAHPGRPRTHALRTIVNALLSLVRSGCAWRLLPHEYPPWKTVYHYFRQWRLDGTWQRIHTCLREAERQRVGRTPRPTAGILDSQSVKTTSVGGPRGYDGGKKLNGRKRHLVVDTLGLVLQAKVHPANLQDRAAVPLVLADIDKPFPEITLVWADQGYTGSGKTWIEEHLHGRVEIVQHPRKPRGKWVPHGDLTDLQTVWFSYERLPVEHTGFRGVLPRRWVVERTFGWLAHSRRLSKDYERRCETSEALIYIAMIRLMVRRLAQSPQLALQAA